MTSTELSELVMVFVTAISDGRLDASEIEQIFDEADDLFDHGAFIRAAALRIEDTMYPDPGEKRALSLRLREDAERLREQGSLKRAARKAEHAARLELEAAEAEDRFRSEATLT